MLQRNHVKTIDDALNLPTMVMLTVALCPVPTLLIGTQVYTPSVSTVMLSTPELLLLIKESLRQNWYTWAAGLASVTQFRDIGEPRKAVVLVGAVVRAVSVGWSKEQRQKKNSECFRVNTKTYNHLLTHSPLSRPCGSTSLLPLVMSSILTVKDNFVC